MAEIYPDFLTWQDHDLDFIMILTFSYLLRLSYKLEQMQGQQLCLQTYGRLVFGSWFIIWIYESFNSNCKLCKSNRN